MKNHLQLVGQQKELPATITNNKRKKKLIRAIFGYIIFFGFNLFLLIDSIRNEYYYSNVLKQSNILDYIKDQTASSILIVISISCILTTCKLPGLLFHPAIGYTFTIAFDSMIIGILIPSLLLLCGISIGSIISFCIGRFIMIRWKRTRGDTNDDCYYQSPVDNARFQKQFIFLLLLRQSSILPLSRHALNYQVGRLSSSFSRLPFFLSLVGYLPGIFFGVVMGSSSATFLNDFEQFRVIKHDVPRVVVLSLGVLMSIICYFIIAFKSKRHLVLFVSHLAGKTPSVTEDDDINCNDTCVVEDLHQCLSQEEDDEREREHQQGKPNNKMTESKLDSEKFLSDMVTIYGYMEETEEMETVLVESRDDSASKSQLHISSGLGDEIL